MKYLKRYLFFIYFIFILAVDLYIFTTILKLNNLTAIYHDNYSLEYPYRILISTSIRNGFLPLWDHWTHGGFPLSISFMNLSPTIILFSLFSIYTIKTFIFEIIILHLIGFIGMFFWLKTYVNKYLSILGSFCFVLSAPIMLQVPINFSIAVTMLLCPWLALGFKKAFQFNKQGIGIISLTLWLLFTTGYLGTNLIIVQFIFLFCFFESLSKKINIKGLFYIGIAIVLFSIIVNLPILEAYKFVRFDLSQFRESPFDPFLGSARLDTLTTLVWPNFIEGLRNFAKYNAVTLILYFGSINVIFLFYALTLWKRNKSVILLLIFIVLSFCLMLSNQYFISRLMTDIVPFYNNIRFHGLNSGLLLFFALTLSSIGFASFYKNEKYLNKFLSIFAYFIFAILLATWQNGSSNIYKYIYYPQTLFFIIFFIVFVVFCYIRLKTKSRYFYFDHLFIFIVLCLILSEYVLVSKELIFLKQDVRLQEDLIMKQEKLKTINFNTYTNIRTDEANYHNGQLYSKIPTLYGYHPMFHPTIKKLMWTKEYLDLLTHIFYSVDENNQPLLDKLTDIQILKFQPNYIKLTIISNKKDNNIVWSSPYTNNWKLYINNQPVKTSANFYGFTTFILNTGLYNIELKYEPFYIKYSFLASIIGIIVSIYYIMLGFFA